MRTPTALGLSAPRRAACSAGARGGHRTAHTARAHRARASVATRPAASAVGLQVRAELTARGIAGRAGAHACNACLQHAADDVAPAAVHAIAADNGHAPLTALYRALRALADRWVRTARQPARKLCRHQHRRHARELPHAYLTRADERTRTEADRGGLSVAESRPGRSAFALRPPAFELGQPMPEHEVRRGFRDW